MTGKADGVASTAGAHIHAEPRPKSAQLLGGRRLHPNLVRLPVRTSSRSNKRAIHDQGGFAIQPTPLAVIAPAGHVVAPVGGFTLERQPTLYGVRIVLDHSAGRLDRLTQGRRT